MKTSTALLALLLPTLGSCVTERIVYPGANPDLPYSAAIRVGNLVFIAGHLGTDAQTNQAPPKIEDEINRMLDRFAETIAKTGLTMDHLVQVQVHCSDVGLYDTFNALYRQRFNRGFPTRAFIGSGTLLRGCHFEIVGICAD